MNNTLRKAWETWGEEKQLIKAVEELAELQQEISKYLLRDKEQPYSLNKMVEELADVAIMTEQIERFLIGGLADVYIAADKKLKRLEDRLNA